MNNEFDDMIFIFYFLLQSIPTGELLSMRNGITKTTNLILKLKHLM